MTIEITRDVARKILETVDAGLVKGVGTAKPGHMCVEAAVCYALGLPHGDDPECVSPALRSLKIALNDKQWSSKAARATGLRRLALAQLGSRGFLDDREFAKHVSESAIRKQVPVALRAAASMKGNLAHRDNLLAVADRCAKECTRAAAYAAYAAAAYAAYAAAAYAAYAAAANAAANAAAASAAAVAANAANAAAYAAADAVAANAAAANAADAAADAAAYAAANAANASKERDRVLSEFAEDVVQILIAMDAPGCQWLSLTEQAA